MVCDVRVTGSIAMQKFATLGFSPEYCSNTRIFFPSIAKIFPSIACAIHAIYKLPPMALGLDELTFFSLLAIYVVDVDEFIEENRIRSIRINVTR